MPWRDKVLTIASVRVKAFYKRDGFGINILLPTLPFWYHTNFTDWNQISEQLSQAVGDRIRKIHIIRKDDYVEVSHVIITGSDEDPMIGIRV